MRIMSMYAWIVTAASVMCAGPANASLVTDNPADPFPNGSGFLLSVLPGALPICVTATECTYTVSVQNLQLASASPIAGGYDFRFSASFFGAFVNPTTLLPSATALLTLAPGTFFDVSVLGGYSPTNGNVLGTFQEVLNAASFVGYDSVGAYHTAALDGSSMGSVTISVAPGGGYLVDNEFPIINTVATLNGVNLNPPPLTAVNFPAPTPIPGSLALFGGALAGLGGLLRRRRLPQAFPV